MALFFELIDIGWNMVLVNVNAISTINPAVNEDGTEDGCIIYTMDGGQPIHVIDDYKSIKENLRKYLPKI